jgi:hypothetical protein
VIGCHRARLNSYLQGVTKKSIQDIRDTATTWSKKATTLTDVAYALGTTRTSGVTEGFGDRSEVARAASRAFTEASTRLTDHAQQLSRGSKTLNDAALALENAHDYRTRIDQRDADAPDPAKSEDANKADDETQSKTYADAIDAAYGDAIVAMRKVHGDQPPPSPPSGSGDGAPSYSGMPSGGYAGGGSGGSYADAGGHRGPGTGTGVHPGGGAYPGGGEGGGGWLQGGDPPTVPTVPTMLAGGAPGGQAPLTTGGTGGTGGTSGMGAGLAGAGAFGLGVYGTSSSAAALRFTPGQAIGVSRSSITSAGILGAEEERVAGARTPGAGAAGGRRTGAVAGGRDQGRDEDREGTAADLWDDGAEWVDDEGMGPSVMR